MLVDDRRTEGLVSALGTEWRAVSDQVMGGVSQAQLTTEDHEGRRCLRLRGEVKLDNDGGFVQMALDLTPGGEPVDVSALDAVRLEVHGNSERYSVHLRTADVVRSWQSYRASFVAGSSWETVELPFAEFVPHRIDRPLDLTRLRRIGLVAIGRAFEADLRVARVELYTVSGEHAV